jgi:hypothetical protein
MKRYSDRIYLSDKTGKNYLKEINNYNKKRGLYGINDISVGEKTEWSFGSFQNGYDDRRNQMRTGTRLETYHLKHRNFDRTGKVYIILKIRIGWIDGVPDQFNGIIASLKRVY